MVNWFEEVIADKIRSAKNHVILVPARNQNAPLDAVDIFDGVTGQFIVADVPEDSAREFALIWNTLIMNGESRESIEQINLLWLTGCLAKKAKN